MGLWRQLFTRKTQGSSSNTSKHAQTYHDIHAHAVAPLNLATMVEKNKKIPFFLHNGCNLIRWSLVPDLQLTDEGLGNFSERL